MIKSESIETRKTYSSLLARKLLVIIEGVILVKDRKKADLLLELDKAIDESLKNLLKHKD